MESKAIVQPTEPQLLPFQYPCLIRYFFSFQSQRDIILSESRRDRVFSESRRERMISENRRDRFGSDGSESRSECRSGPSKRRHRRYSTESADSPEKDMISFADLIKGKAQPSNLASELLRHTDYDDSVLGQVRLLHLY